MPVVVPETTEVSGLGAAMCAAAASGAYANLEEAVVAMGPETTVVEPDRLAVLEYDEHYRRWNAAAELLEKLSELP
jgi:sugar (pentulose or hexulose) kinase